jgi:hypothetical protein
LVVSECDVQPPPFLLRIVAVEAVDGGYRAYPVRWEVFDPIIGGNFNFDLVVLPRVAGRVTFMPLAEGNAADTPTTLRHQARLDLYPGNQPTVTP